MEAVTAEQIALAILYDVTDRRGWRQEWDGFDASIRRDILERWTQIIQAEGLDCPKATTP